MANFLPTSAAQAKTLVDPKIVATNKAKADAATKALAASRNPANNVQAQISQIAAPMVPDTSPWSGATQGYVNPYYIGERPLDEYGNPKYDRFDIDQEGAGVQYDKNPALAFDQLFGSQYVPRLDIPGTDMQRALLQSQSGGLGGAAGQAITDGSISPELQAALDYNAGFDKYNDPKYTYDGLDEYYKQAFDEYGLDANSIGSLDAINKLDPKTKAAVVNSVAVQKQAQNQIPPSGILDSLPGKIALGLVGAINPYAAAGLGAFAGGMSGEGGVFNALKGATQGYGYGEILNKGITLPDWAGGGQILKPVVYNGVPAGVNPLDFIDGLKGTVAPNAAGATPAGSVGNVYTPGGNQSFTFGPPAGGGGGGTSVYDPSGGASGDGTTGGAGGDVIQPGGTVPSGTINMPPAPVPPPPVPPPGGISNALSSAWDLTRDAVGIYNTADYVQGILNPNTQSGPAQIPATSTPSPVYTPPTQTPQSDVVYQSQGSEGAGGSSTGVTTPSQPNPQPLPSEDTIATYDPNQAGGGAAGNAGLGIGTGVTAGVGVGAGGGTDNGNGLGEGPGTGMGESQQPPQTTDLPDYAAMDVYTSGSQAPGTPYTPYQAPQQQQQGPQTIYPGFFGATGLPDEAKPGYKHGTRPGSIADILRPYQPTAVYARA